MGAFQPHQPGGPFAQHAITPHAGLEFLLLIERELLLEALLTIVERRHVIPVIGKVGVAYPAARRPAMETRLPRGAASRRTRRKPASPFAPGALIR